MRKLGHALIAVLAGIIVLAAGRVSAVELEPDNDIPTHFLYEHIRIGSPEELKVHDKCARTGKEGLLENLKALYACRRTVVPSGADIPMPRYQSWSLFLVCNNSWLRSDSLDKLDALYKRFEAFGRAIGESHVAVWFAKRKASPRIVERLDVDRSAAYCARFGLDPRESPHVFVTTSYPSLSNPSQRYLVLRLNGLTPDSIETLLGTLSAQILGQSLDQSEVDSEIWWLKIKQSVAAVFDVIGDIATKIKVTLKIKDVEVTVEPR